MCVYGKDEAEHDRNLLRLMDRAAACGLVFNSEKCFIKQRSISFFGNTYTDAGIMPDPAKVRDIENMPVPENKEDLQRFLGIMTYLSQFIPKFSEKVYALRILTKDDVPWTWDTDQQKSFDLDCFTTHGQTMSYFTCLIRISVGHWELSHLLNGFSMCF